MAFGRMSPPTTGHEVLVNKVKDVAKSVGGGHSVVLSHTQDKDKNPLSSADKLKHAKRFFPKTNLSTSSKDSPTFLSHAEKLHKQGVTHLHMVAGSDRVDEYKKKLAQYNGTHKGALFNFKKITVHSAGERDPDAEGTTGMSASKMRSHASSGNFKEFKKGVPAHVPEHHAKEMFHDVRKGMQIKEENELKESDLNRFSKYVMKVTKTEPKIVRKTNPAGRTTDHVEYEVHGTLSSHKKSFKSKKEAEEYFKTVKEENEPRIPKKEGQPDKSDKHSDLYTDEDPKGTIQGLKFATTEDAEASVRKIKSSGRPHAHKIQAAIAMEQRAKVMGKASAAAVYRSFINSMKEKTKDVNEEFEILLEGVHDQGIFKVIFLAGGPGSGKDYVLNNTLDGQGLTEINSDKALEFLMDKEGLNKTMPADETEKRNLVRGRAKNITELRQQLALLGRNGLIINGTGDDVAKTKKIKDQLEKLGYESSMLLVNTRDDISAQRNIERGQRGGRAVPEPIRKEKWDNVQYARTEYAKMFGANYSEFDNSEDLRQADPETVKAKKDELLGLFNKFREFVATPPQSQEAQFWTANELDKKDSLPIPKGGAEQLPPSNDSTASEASKLGLQYYGFGRYGKNGKVTHRSVHGQLVMVNKEVAQQPKIPISSSSGTKPTPVKESSDTPKGKMLKDSNGKLRIFMLRTSAAKEAHQKNGTILKYKNGYIVKLNEETENVNISKKSIYNEDTSAIDTAFTETIGSGTSSTTGISATGRTIAEHRASGSFTRTSADTGTATETCTEETTRSKLTLAEIRTRQKEKVIESIDKGIEPGLSMAASGENLGRGGLTRTKLLKKPLEELTGDETGASIGDQKEGELKRVGINLNTFKSKKFVG